MVAYNFSVHTFTFYLPLNLKYDQHPRVDPLDLLDCIYLSVALLLDDIHKYAILEEKDMKNRDILMSQQ